MAYEALKRGPWSLDLVGTAERAGLGVARDLYSGPLLELDAGVYGTIRYAGENRRPMIGVGVHGRW